MADANVVVLSGRLTSDPVSKKVGEFDTCSFRMASNTNAGKDKERTLFIEVNTWSGLANTVQKFKKKGDQVVVTGQLRLDQWEKDGQKQSKIYVEARDVSFVGGQGGSDAPAPAPAPAPTTQRTSPPVQRPRPSAPVATVEDDQPPF